MSRFRLILCTFLLLGGSVCWGQRNVVFNGVLTDSATGNPLEFASVILLDSVQDIRYATMSDEYGRFTMQNVHCQSYTIVIDHPECPTYKEEILVKSHEGYFYYRAALNVSDTLDPLIVRSFQPGTQVHVDRKVFVPDTAHLHNCSSGLDVLKQVPGIRVSTSDDAISLYGNSNVLVLIDGEYSHRSLSSINPKDIARVEVIKNPSAQFSSEVRNVINVILKEESKQGGSFGIDALASCPNYLIKSGLQFEYEYRKFRFYADFRFRNIQFDWRDSTVYENENSAVSDLDISVEDPARSRLRSFSAQYGIDYNINENNVLRFAGDFTNLNFLSSSTTKGTFSEGNSIVYHKTGVSSAPVVNNQQNYSLFYKHQFKRYGHELRINTNFFILNRNEKSESLTKFIFPDESRTFNSINDTTDVRMRNANVLIDYVLPLKHHIELSLGAHEYFRHIDHAYLGDLTAYSMTYNELRSAAYLQLKYSPFPALTLAAGLRAEHNWSRLYDSIRNSYWHPLPVFSLSYIPARDHSLTLSYRERLSYPNYRYLDPFVRYRTDSLARSEGNPFLKPEHVRAIELEYSFFPYGVYLTVTPYVKFCTNQIQRAHSLAAGNVLVERYQNVGLSNYYGVSMDFMTDFCDWFEPYVYMDLYYAQFQNRAFNGWTWDFMLDLSFYLPLDFEIDASLTYTTKEHTCDGWTRQGALLDEISVTKGFFRGDLQLTLAVCDLLPDKFTTYSYSSDYQVLTTQNKFGPYAYLKVAYRFAKGKKLKEVLRYSIQEKEHEM